MYMARWLSIQGAESDFTTGMYSAQWLSVEGADSDSTADRYKAQWLSKDGAELGSSSVVDPKWFNPDRDPDPALNSFSSGSGSRQKFWIHADPDPTHIIYAWYILKLWTNTLYSIKNKIVPTICHSIFGLNSEIKAALSFFAGSGSKTIILDPDPGQKSRYTQHWDLQWWMYSRGFHTFWVDWFLEGCRSVSLWATNQEVPSTLQFLI